MTLHGFATSLALATLAIAGIAGAVSAGDQVPFRGDLEGVATLAPANPPPFLSVLVDATGSATLLGQFTLTIPHLVNPVTRTAAGTYDFVASNGDTLSADFTGVSAPTATPGVISIVENATITGGTGRFAGATGAFTAERSFNLSSGATTGSFEGTISSVGASH
jgi:hypothetical protein